MQSLKNYRFDDLCQKILDAGLLWPLDVLLVGATGAGKSSTLNAVFGMEVAKVGDGVEPETQCVSSHGLHEFLRLHDCAGLGDGKAADLEHTKNIVYELQREITVGGQPWKFMDLALVLLDGGSRDMGTAFRLLESVVLKNIEPQRVIVAINQADMAMKGRHWNHEQNRPEAALAQFLDEKAESVQRRILESTGLRIRRPVCYSARAGYNVCALMDHIIDHVPTSRRPSATVSG